MVSTRTIVVGGLACIAVAGAATLYYRYGWRSLPISSKQKPGKTRRKTRAAKSAASTEAVSIPPESDLIGKLLSSMERMQSTGSVSGPNETSLAKIVLAASSSPDALSVRCRLMAAQWTILYQTLLSVSSPTSTIDLGAHEAAMKQAWALLDLPLTNLSADERSAVDILQLDVAQRLRNPSLMIPVYERLLQRLASSSLSSEETLVLFTSAPLLGRWNDTRRIGSMIILQQQSLDEFHQAALQRPELPDYSVLHDQAVARKLADQTDLAWSAYSIRQLRIRLRDVQASDASKAAEVRAAVAEDWQPTPVTPDARLFRHGAIGQMLSASEVKISCVGPWDGSGVDLQGWADLQKGQNPADGKVRQTERYQFSCEGPVAAEGTWAGTYTLSQTDRDSNITVVFDLEMDLKLDESLSPSPAQI